MTLLYVRAIAPYQPGANATDVIINQIHFDRLALDHYNYTLYTNGTLSNGTDCYLAFQHFQPYMFPNNGSFVNGTSCFSPIHDIGQHAAVGMAFALLFAISILCSLTALRKHGRRYLPLDKRWNPLGRRWKWYWLMALGVCATIASFMSIDVDRDHVQHSPLVLQSVFYTLMTPFMLAAVWEAVRHWGSWQERQVFTRDQFAFTEKTTRKQQELALPLIFYLFAFINFFLAVPRNWDRVELQRSPQQQALQAKPFATDTRFKAASFMGLVTISVICYILGHSMYRYIPRPLSSRSIGKRALFYIQGAPPQFLVAITLLIVKISYDIASAFSFSISPLRYTVNPGWIYGLGYTPVLLLITLFNFCGLCEENEDKALILQSTELESAFAGDLGVNNRRKNRLCSNARNTWLGRVPRLGHRERQRLLHSSHEDEYYRSVEMSTITNTSGARRVEDKKLREEVIAAAAAAAAAGSQSSGGSVADNPFIVDSDCSSCSSSSSSSSSNDGDGDDGGRDSTDTRFVKDVLDSLKEPETGKDDRAD